MRCQAGGGQVTLRPMADNDDARPRATLLLTRPRAMSERFAAEVAERDLPVDIVIVPLMEIVATDAPPSLTADTGVIFTSSQAVARAGPGDGRRAWCVGARTTEAARTAGFDAVLAGACADVLVARLLQERPSGPLVHLRGRHQRGDVAARLCDAGLQVTSHVLYDQVEVPPGAAFTTALRHSPLWVPLFSPRSAELFAAAARERWTPAPDDAIVALSAAVMAGVPPEWAEKTEVIEHPDGPSMLDAIARRIYP
jgi:uroporphyrinogen-III synthase